ncbi:MAG: dihydrofolate reductase [Nanoarchaeota archaeon]|nr:dihydrofolate reductase [Nanoarchaeota archaeon]
MVEIIIIVGIADNNIIGKDGKIPWDVPEDFAHFKGLTIGHPCIMGDKTYNDLPIKPLPGRENIVLSFDKDYAPEGITVKNSWEEALEYCENKQKVFICGGASIYKLALPIADTFELTRIHQEPEGDTSFPEIDWSEWKLHEKEEHPGYTFETYKRIKKSDDTE